MNRKRYKRIRGSLSGDWLRNKDSENSDQHKNMLLEAMANTDLLSEDQGMFPERDIEGEYTRRKFTVRFRFSLRYLTNRQKQIVKALRNMTQEEAAKSLGISRSTLSMHLPIIQKKILKYIGKWEKQEQSIGE